jgi:phage-related protein
MSLVAVRVKRGGPSGFSVYFIEENDECDLLQFLESVSSNERARIFRDFDYFANHGQIKNPEKSKPIGDKLFELRTHGGVRVFYFMDAGRLIFCTNGYVKKKQKLDPREIQQARNMRDRYLAAKQDNTIEFREDETP